jgi:hypothetical protein
MLFAASEPRQGALVLVEWIGQGRSQNDITVFPGEIDLISRRQSESSSEIRRECQPTSAADDNLIRDRFLSLISIGGHRLRAYFCTYSGT